jgi:hypothetical protein
MRDKLKDKEYFNNFIAKKNENFAFYIDALKNNEVDSERINNVIEEVFRQNLYKLIAKYSAGYPIEELYSDYYEAVEYMHQSWMVLDNRAFLNERKYGHYFGSDYDLMLWMLSIGYLLNVEEKEFLKLVEILDKDGVKDLIYETIIKAKIPTRPVIEKETYEMIFDIPFVYEKLRQAIHEGIDGIWDKDRQRDLVEVFIKKDWYPRHKDFSFYDNHKSKTNVYYGYWSFETAAICKILEIDVSKIIDFKYFPKDLYLYKK